MVADKDPVQFPGLIPPVVDAIPATVPAHTPCDAGLAGTAAMAAADVVAFEPRVGCSDLTPLTLFPSVAAPGPTVRGAATLDRPLRLLPAAIAVNPICWLDAFEIFHAVPSLRALPA